MSAPNPPVRAPRRSRAARSASACCPCCASSTGCAFPSRSTPPRPRWPASALDEGASIVNDISGLQYDPALGDIVAVRGAPLVLMHMRGTPSDMYAQARYGDVAAEVTRELTRAVERAVSRGVRLGQIVVDPGLGFAKRAEHSLALLAGLADLAALGRPILVGPSRKSFLAAAAGPGAARDRDWATAAAVTAAVLGGAHIVRVHAVPEMVQVSRAADMMREHGAVAPGAGS